MFTFNEDGTYRRNVSREEIEWLAFNRGYDKGYEKEGIRIARKMLKDGYSIQDVSEITELPIEKVKKLIKKLKTLRNTT